MYFVKYIITIIVGSHQPPAFRKRENIQSNSSAQFFDQSENTKYCQHKIKSSYYKKKKYGKGGKSLHSCNRSETGNLLKP